MQIDKLRRDTVKIFRGEYGVMEGLMPVAANETDADVLKKYVAIHFPHKISPVIKDFLAHEKIVSILTTALVNHYMSAESMLPWDQDGKLPSTEDMRDIVMVAGTDPYSAKPITDMNKPYLRPEVLVIKK